MILYFKRIHILPCACKCCVWCIPVKTCSIYWPCKYLVMHVMDMMEQHWARIILIHLPLDKMAAILADNIFKCIFLNENVWILLKISLWFVPKIPIDNIPALVQIMAWRHSGNKPLLEPMMVSLLTHICITRPQWVNPLWPSDNIWRHGTKPLPEPLLTYHQHSAGTCTIYLKVKHWKYWWK